MTHGRLNYRDMVSPEQEVISYKEKLAAVEQLEVLKLVLKDYLKLKSADGVQPLRRNMRAKLLEIVNTPLTAP